MGDPAPLLPPAAVEGAKRVAAAVRQGRVAPLVGSGISCQSGLPPWSALVGRIIRAWQRYDEEDGTWSARHLSHNYPRLLSTVFADDLSLTAYVRDRLTRLRIGMVPFSRLLYPALYGRSDESRSVLDLFTPEPTHVHRHLVALFAAHPRRIWTTNYDDLLEEAARLAHVPVRPLDLGRRAAADDLAVAHLHGFLRPPDRRRGKGHPDPDWARVILAEDDYHETTAEAINWTNREFARLLDEHRALILGMSLNDPNLRRVLATLAHRRRGGEPTHYAIMRSLGVGDREISGLSDSERVQAAADANAFRAAFWEQQGVRIIELPDHQSILPFLVRVRY